MSDWPDTFDFTNDHLCQTVFKPFILKELSELRAYDDQRPDDKTYIFHQHAARVARDVKKTCLHMGLSGIVAENMYWATLPHDIGKHRLPIELWDTDEKPTDTVKKIRRTHTLLGAQIVQEMFPDIDHPFKDLMIDIMKNHHEQLDGNGTNGVSGDSLSAPVRLSAIVEAYDGYCIWRPHFGDRDISPEGVLKKMKEEKGADIYDIPLLESFAEMKLIDYNDTQNWSAQ